MGTVLQGLVASIENKGYIAGGWRGQYFHSFQPFVLAEIVARPSTTDLSEESGESNREVYMAKHSAQYIYRGMDQTTHTHRRNKRNM